MEITKLITSIRVGSTCVAHWGWIVLCGKVLVIWVIVIVASNALMGDEKTATGSLRLAAQNMLFEACNQRRRIGHNANSIFVGPESNGPILTELLFAPQFLIAPWIYCHTFGEHSWLQNTSIDYVSTAFRPIPHIPRKSFLGWYQPWDLGWYPPWVEQPPGFEPRSCSLLAVFSTCTSTR